MRISRIHFQIIKEICEVFMVRQPVRIFVSLFCSRTCPMGVRQIDEDSNRITTQNQPAFGNIFGRYSFDGKDNAGIISEQWYINLRPLEFRFCNKHEKVSSKSDGNFRLDHRYLTNEHLFNRGKFAEGHKTMSGNVWESLNHSVEARKIYWPTFVDSSNGFTSKSLVPVSTGVLNLSIKTRNFYQTQVILSSWPKSELLWWTENLKISIGRKIMLLEPHLVIQTDASTKDWGAHCKGISGRGCGERKKKHFMETSWN